MDQKIVFRHLIKRVALDKETVGSPLSPSLSPTRPSLTPYCYRSPTASSPAN